MQNSFLMAVVSAGIGVAVAPAPLTGALRWAERDVAVFSTIMFDFKKELMFSESVNSELRDCSTATTYCLKTSAFELSLPRSCDLSTAVGKGPDATGLAVIAETDQPLQHLQLKPDFMLLIYNVKYPFIVYEYVPASGIIGVSYDSIGMLGVTPRADIVASIKAGNYAREKQQRWSYSRRLTLDSFGACRAG